MVIDEVTEIKIPTSIEMMHLGKVERPLMILVKETWPLSQVR